MKAMSGCLSFLKIKHYIKNVGLHNQALE